MKALRSLAARAQEHAIESAELTLALKSVVLRPLTIADQTEVLEFLGKRPFHTFGLRGLILSNGLESPLNRGAFYACRDKHGRLEGVGLIGYNCLFEARSSRATKAFATLFRMHKNPFLLMGEEENIHTFLNHYKELGPANAEINRYILFKQSWPIEVRKTVRGLRRATRDDLGLVVKAHNQSGIEETGVDGLKQDRLGFTQRCANRIEQGRTWVWIRDHKLIFKVEVMTATPEVTYLESLWIDPRERNKGYGLKCLAQLGEDLLRDTASICLLVNESNVSACAFYQRAGYEKAGHYLVIFLSPPGK